MISNNVLNSVKIPEMKQRITKIIANKLRKVGKTLFYKLFSWDNKLFFLY